MKTECVTSVEKRGILQPIARKKDKEKLVNAYQEEEEATEESTALALPHAPRQWRE